MKKNIKELDIVDFDEMVQRVEEEAIKIENNFLQLITESNNEDGT